MAEQPAVLPLYACKPPLAYSLHRLILADPLVPVPPCSVSQVETRISCPLSAMQTFWYRRLLLKDKAALQSIEKEVEGSVKVGAGEPGHGCCCTRPPCGTNVAA